MPPTMLKYSLPALLRAACAGLQPANRDVNSRRLRVLLGSLSCFFIINKIADFILRVSAKCSLAIYHMLQTPDVCSTVTKSDGFVFGYKEMSKTRNVRCFLQALKLMLKATMNPQSWRRAPKAAVRPASASCLWDECATIVQLGAVTNE